MRSAKFVMMLTRQGSESAYPLSLTRGLILIVHLLGSRRVSQFRNSKSRLGLMITLGNRSFFYKYVLRSLVPLLQFLQQKVVSLSDLLFIFLLRTPFYLRRIFVVSIFRFIDIHISSTKVMSRLCITSATPLSSDETTLTLSTLTTSSSLSGETNAPQNDRKSPYAILSESAMQPLIPRHHAPGQDEAMSILAYPKIVIPHLLDDNLDDMPIRHDPEGHELDDLEDQVVKRIRSSKKMKNIRSQSQSSGKMCCQRKMCGQGEARSSRKARMR